MLLLWAWYRLTHSTRRVLRNSTRHLNQAPRASHVAEINPAELLRRPLNSMYSSCSHLGTTVSSSKNSWTHIRAQSANGPMHSPPRGVPRQGLPRVVHGTPPQVLVSGSAVGPELTLGRTVSPSSAVELRAGRRPGRKRSRPVRDTAARGSAQTRPSVSRAPRPHAGDPEALPVLLPSWAAGILSQALSQGSACRRSWGKRRAACV